MDKPALVRFYNECHGEYVIVSSYDTSVIIDANLNVEVEGNGSSRLGREDAILIRDFLNRVIAENE